MWVVIHLAQNLKDAESIRGYLEDENILCRIKPVMPAGDSYYEVSVIQSEAQEAYAIIIEKGY